MHFQHRFLEQVFISCRSDWAARVGGMKVGPGWAELQIGREVTNCTASRIRLESQTIEGDSPVGESCATSWIWFPSSAGHVKSRVNLGGPPSKAKHYQLTDSELVPRGKGEKHPGRGVK